MVLEFLKTNTVNLPLVGSIPLAGVIVVGLAIYFLTKRKKSITLRV
tara:strand:- start:509 stop:646 length:138 start_codon:yes stop_codon:yes gene_type:complete